MKPEAAAILWTALLLLWLRPGVLPGILVAIVCFEVFYLLSSLPITFLQHWPALRPSSVPLSIVASVLFVGTAIHRYRYFHHVSPNDRNA